MKSKRSYLFISIIAVALLSAGCSDSSSDDSSADSSAGSSTTTACEGASIATSDICTLWQLNTTGETSANIRDEATGLTAPEVNVQSVTANAAEDFVTVSATGIPNYVRTVTADDMTYFGTFASSDWANGTATTASLGDVIEWGGKRRLRHGSKNLLDQRGRQGMVAPEGKLPQ